MATTNHSKNFDKVKNYFVKELWNKTRVYNVVGKGLITAEEYEEITGEKYKKANANYSF